MANQYGLKEVADVYLVEINTTDTTIKNKLFDSKGNLKKISAVASGDKLSFKIGDCDVVDPTSETVSATQIAAAFKFDSLKTSNIEVASEETTAKGGKGNPELISWSYGKTATLTLTDALLTPETLGLMYGKNGSLSTNGVLTIDAKSFPSNYVILGTTLLRPLEGGDDVPFGFVIPKGKINVGGTLTMEAEGDPSTFEMTIKALAQDINTDTKDANNQDIIANDVLLQFIVPSGN